jgi:hypothetical protein
MAYLDEEIIPKSMDESFSGCFGAISDLLNHFIVI